MRAVLMSNELSSDLRCVCISDWQAERARRQVLAWSRQRRKSRDEDGDKEVRVIKTGEKRTSRGTTRAE